MKNPVSTKETNIVLIAAISDNNIIGDKNSLIWRLPNDLKRFKELTNGCNMIMGRKTFESLPGILPNRKHVVLTQNDELLKNNHGKDNLVYRSLLPEAIFEDNSINPDADNVFIIGGAEIYKLGLEIANVLELTIVHGNFEGDTEFPIIDFNKWEQVSQEICEADEKHKYSYTFKTYKRK